jgi:hypothetical protein
VTGDITMDPATATRLDAPMVVLKISAAGVSTVDRNWAAYSGYMPPTAQPQSSPAS